MNKDLRDELEQRIETLEALSLALTEDMAEAFTHHRAVFESGNDAECLKYHCLHNRLVFTHGSVTSLADGLRDELRTGVNHE